MMFGKKKETQEELQRLKTVAELDDRFFAQMADGKEMFYATVAELEESFRQVGADADQLTENIKSAAALASDNVQTETELSRMLSACQEAQDAQQAAHVELLEQLAGVERELTDLVDDNKHFTSPSKYLSGIPAELMADGTAARAELDRMEECSKRMSVLALNAAIEAGRMGEAGKQFVAAAEEIRVCTSDYNQTILQSRQRLADADERVRNLEEQVHRLVALLKENNVAAAKIMKNCGQVLQHAKENEASLAELGEAANKVTILKNADEEIVKSEERNRMQMEDLTAEFAAQEKNHKEALLAVDPLYRHLTERKAEGKGQAED